MFGYTLNNYSRMSALMAPSGECLLDVVDWSSGVFASCCHRSNCSLMRAMDARAGLALQHH